METVKETVVGEGRWVVRWGGVVNMDDGEGRGGCYVVDAEEGRKGEGGGEGRKGGVWGGMEYGGLEEPIA